MLFENLGISRLQKNHNNCVHNNLGEIISGHDIKIKEEITI